MDLLLVELKAVFLLAGVGSAHGALASKVVQFISAYGSFLVCGFAAVGLVLGVLFGSLGWLVVFAIVLAELEEVGDVGELLTCKLLFEANELRSRFLVGLKEVQNNPGKAGHKLLAVEGARCQLFVPWIWAFHDLLGQVQRTHRQITWLDMNTRIVQQRYLNHILGQISRHLINLSNLHKSLQTS